MTLEDVFRLFVGYVPKRSVHDASAGCGAQSWWPAHELGHLLTVPRAWIGLPYFGMDPDLLPEAQLHVEMDPKDEHRWRCYELAAMSISRQILIGAGCLALADQEIAATDPVTLGWSDRGSVRRILRRRGCLSVPASKTGLEAMIRNRLGDAR